MRQARRIMQNNPKIAYSDLDISRMSQDAL